MVSLVLSGVSRNVSGEFYGIKELFTDSWARRPWNRNGGPELGVCMGARPLA